MSAGSDTTTETERLRVLVFEGQGRPVSAATLLAEAGAGRYAVTRVAALAAALAHVTGPGADCVVLDLAAGGLERLEALRAAAPEVPVVALAERFDVSLGVRALQGGAQDVLSRGDLDAPELARAVELALERRRAELGLSHAALHDPLTGLPNRVLFVDRLAQATARRRPKGRSLAVVFLDLDRFKAVNDTLGHAAGDELLVAVAERLARALRAGDTAARLGGDEFAVLCDDIDGPSQALAIAERLLAELAEPFVVGDREVTVGASLGIGLARDDGDELLREADAAMYRAKARGGGIELFDDVTRARTRRRAELQDALRHAIAGGELRMHYQPQVRLATGEVIGVEGLVRWQHPERGLLQPAEFLPVAEESGLIVPLGHWVLGEATRQAARWASRAGASAAPVPVAVNLTARQCSHPELVSQVQGALSAAGLDAGLLRLEVSETAVLGDFEARAAMLDALRGLGVGLAVDDFGAGPSSLATLQRLPVQAVTVDRSLVEGVERGGAPAAVLGALVSLAHALGLRTVAEGVELAGQADRLRLLGCDAAQGFLFARPERAEALGGLLGATA